jgi:hypothetical protein
MGGLRVGWRSATTIFLAMAALLTGCAASSPDSVVGATHGHTPASQYLAIATTGNDRLETDIDGLTGRDRDRLSASVVDLRDASVTEKVFDRALLVIALPPAIERIAERLYSVNQSRAKLTTQAALARNLGELHHYEAQISVANASVETQVRLIRRALDLPPPMTS